MIERGGSHADVMPNERPKLYVAAVLIAVTNFYLPRNVEYAHDLAGPVAILGVWLLGRARRRPRADRPIQAVTALVRGSGRVIVAGRDFIAASVLALAAVAAVTLVEPGRPLRSLNIADGLASMFAQLAGSPPVNGFAPAGRPNPADRAIVRYFYECTQPNDRLLLVGSTPFDVPYYTERGFAGGTVFHIHDCLSSPQEQRRTLARLESQSVPFALSTRGDETVLETFRRYKAGHGLSRGP